MSADISIKVPYSIIKMHQALGKIPTYTIQRTLVVASLACAIISLIPGLGFWGSLALRSTALIGTGTQCIVEIKNNGMKGVMLQVMRAAFIALGLTGLILHSPLIATAALAGDTIFQIIFTGQGIHKKEMIKPLRHFGCILINAFMLAALLTGSSPYMITAAVLSAAVMIFFAVIAVREGIITEDPSKVFDTICYLGLTAIGVASAVTVKNFLTAPLGGTSSVMTDDFSELEHKEKSFSFSAGLQNQLAEFRRFPHMPTSVIDAGRNDVFNIILFNKNSTKHSSFSLSTICNQAVYFTSHFRMHPPKAEENEREFHLDADNFTYDLLIQFFQNGSVQGLDKLTEKQLINLYTTADFLQSKRLQELCVMEIAYRLEKLNWQRISLLKPFQRKEQLLSKLVNLYAF